MYIYSHLFENNLEFMDNLCIKNDFAEDKQIFI